MHLGGVYARAVAMVQHREIQERIKLGVQHFTKNAWWAQSSRLMPKVSPGLIMSFIRSSAPPAARQTMLYVRNSPAVAVAHAREMAATDYRGALIVLDYVSKMAATNSRIFDATNSWEDLESVLDTKENLAQILEDIRSGRIRSRKLPAIVSPDKRLAPGSLRKLEGRRFSGESSTEDSSTEASDIGGETRSKRPNKFLPGDDSISDTVPEGRFADLGADVRLVQSAAGKRTAGGERSQEARPYYTVKVNCELSELIKVRDSLNKYSSVKVSVLDIVLKGAAIACQRVAQANAFPGSNGRTFNEDVNIYVAIPSPQGTICVTLESANRKGVQRIAQEMAAAIIPHPDAGISVGHVSAPATFAVSMAGKDGKKLIERNVRPQVACILTFEAEDMGALLDTASKKVSKANKISAKLSCNRGVVDGSAAAQWVEEFVLLLRNPHFILL